MKKTNDKNCELFSKNGCKLVSESEQLKLLQKLIQLISESKDFNSALNIIMKTFCETTGWDYAEAWIPENDNLLRCHKTWFKDIELKKFKNISQDRFLKRKQGLAGRIWLSKKTEWITDISAENEKVFIRLLDAKEAGLKAAFGIPIISDKTVNVILIFFLKEPCQEDKNLLNLISTVATHLGWVIKHKEFEERFINSFKYTFTGRALVAINGKFIEVNNSFCNMLNYSEKQLLNKAIQDVLSEDTLDEFMINAQDLLAKKFPVFNKQVKFYTKKGKTLWTQMEITIVFNSINVPLYFILNIQDISFQKNSEQEKDLLTEQLYSAQDQVKALKNLLPVCAWCKKIRNEKGNWEQLEDYFSHYSNINLTHGICEQCAKKHAE